MAADDDAVATIRKLTGGLGADVVVDCVGVDSTLRLGAAVGKVLGHLTIVGIGGGALPVGFFTVPNELSVATTYWGSVIELMEVIALAERGDISAHVTTFPFAEAAAVYDRLRAGEIAGRAVVIPD